jgi:hypothetical protein
VKFYKPGCHPNSLANLRPRRRGQPSLNPYGRRGKPVLTESILDDPQWLAYVRSVERDTKMLDRIFRRQLGVSLDQAWNHLRKRR